ncbi:hypothetical protein GLA29479_1194 [Lysobacter antibioticus]|nr:hypothetical protein GLA29479_1194 [Lysobacter antibioticus]
MHGTRKPSGRGKSNERRRGVLYAAGIADPGRGPSISPLERPAATFDAAG